MRKQTIIKKWLFVLISIFYNAQAHALNVQLFRPNFDQQGGISVENTKILPQKNLYPGVFLNWVRNPIEFGTVPAQSHTDNIVGWVTTADIIFAMSIKENLTLGLDLPFNLASKIEPIGLTASSKKLGLGDITLYAKYRMREKNDNDGKLIPAVAVLPFVGLPTGSDSNFFGDGTVAGGFKFIFDWDLAEHHHLSMNLGPKLRTTEKILNLTVGSELLASLGYNYLISEEKKMNLYVEFVGSTTFSKFFADEISSPIEFLIGVRRPWMNDKLLTTAGVGRGINNGYGAPEIRLFVGATYMFDRSQPIIDTDTDGIRDKRDQCPDQPEDKDGFEDKDGCPDPDNDHDGILDAEDKCPLQPETINGVEDKDGCPDVGETKVKIEGSRIVILDKVYFDTSKDVILAKSNDILNQVVATLKANPQIKKIRVEGHTDDRGADKTNMALSQKRANSVLQYLVKEGIAADRLEAVGYGKTKPIDTNATAKGREINRRVEFNIIDGESAPQIPATSP